MKQPLLFNSRTDEGRELSNFYVESFPIALKCGVYVFSSAEAVYQCLKQPKLTKGKVTPFQLATPSAAKKFGKTIELRPDWYEVRDDVMRYVLEAKFAVPVLREYLLETGDRVLVHLAPWDSYWGDGRDGKGLNRLGTLLMELRDNVRNTTGQLLSS